MTWIRRHLLALAALVVLVYMLIPNVIVAVYSFNDPVGRYNYTWERFSTDAWAHPCGAQGICEALGLSLRIGLTASLVATALGTMIAFALGRYRFRGRAATNLLIFMPMATPEVVMGSSLLTLFLMMGIPAGGRAPSAASTSSARASRYSANGSGAPAPSTQTVRSTSTGGISVDGRGLRVSSVLIPPIAVSPSSGWIWSPPAVPANAGTPWAPASNAPPPAMTAGPGSSTGTAAAAAWPCP